MRMLGRYNETTKEVEWITEEDRKTPKLHFVQDDTIEPTMSHATDEGKIFTSRSELNKHYKEHGFECTGGSHLTGKGLYDFKYPKPNPREIRDTIEKVACELDAGMHPLTEKERERWVTRRE